MILVRRNVGNKGLTLTKEPKFDRQYQVDDQKEREDEASLEILGEDCLQGGRGTPVLNPIT
ncbi:hypothetical protein FRX31_028209 [Thalictrum thalictroides]|uniref:Uncharacterized protein n=1 Tax=Thalictrum thalictroides TaxID=46969 RepID=A0A7J6VAT5_THATH|nr:hypothetical protein FRX31_028209 [Thalictrum thalictroides]